MAYADDLVTLRDNIAAKLATVISEESEKPSYTVVAADGTTQNVQWMQYYQMLFNQLEKLNELIAQQDGPWIINQYESID